MTAKANERVLELTGVQVYNARNALENFLMSVRRFKKGSMYSISRKNVRAFMKVLEHIEEVRKDIGDKLDPERGIAAFTGQAHPDPAIQEEFTRMFQEVLNDSHKVIVVPMSVDHLNLGEDGNHISIQDLDALMAAGVVVEEEEETNAGT